MHRLVYPELLKQRMALFNWCTDASWLNKVSDKRKKKKKKRQKEDLDSQGCPTGLTGVPLLLNMKIEEQVRVIMCSLWMRYHDCVSHAPLLLSASSTEWTEQTDTTEKWLFTITESLAFIQEEEKGKREETCAECLGYN